MALAEILKITHDIREIVIDGTWANLLIGAIHDLYTLRRKRSKSNGDRNTNRHPTSGNRHRSRNVSVISYLYRSPS